jgi:hypothetical protein
MAKNAEKTSTKNSAKKATTRSAVAVLPAPAPGVPETVELRARVTGEVRLRLRVLDARYTAEKIAKLLNAGNQTWDVGDLARYHRIEKGGKVVAELEYADEDVNWEHYRAD